MNSREKGFLLLSSHLGDGSRKVLTPAQLRTLAARVRTLEPPEEDRELREEDLISLGYRWDMAHRIVRLLEDEQLLEHYCAAGRKQNCFPLTRISAGYPGILRSRLGEDSPGCLWTRGDTALLKKPAVALVGSRDLLPENRKFAHTVGEMAAEKGLVLVSGNARGADRAAQEACLANGGRVISVLADALAAQPEREGVLYLSEDAYEEGFSSQRALSRNRCIHALGQITFVAQCALESGGTWAGTVKNLRRGWSTVACFRDGSPASRELERLGAYLIALESLQDFDPGFQPEISLFD